MDRHEINIENFNGIWEDSPLTILEKKFISDNKISHNVVKERRLFLKRSLSLEELIILEVIEREGILFRDEYFKPFRT